MNPLLILLTEGMKGEPLPYVLRSDWMVTVIIFLCLISLSYIISKTKKHLQQQLKTVFSSRERASLNLSDLHFAGILYFLLHLTYKCNGH